MLLVGLTGGIASGKSVVAARMAEHGAVVVDADRLAREVVEPGTSALERIAEEFGPQVIAPDGTLDRAALGAQVFSDPQKLALLNSITHPAVRDLSHRRFAEAAEADPDAIVVYDVPLLTEARGADEFDVVVVVSAPAEVRIERMVSLRGMSRDEAERRIRSQVPEEQRRALADIVIESGGTLEQTLARADEVWDELHERAVGGRA
ncbi:MAG: dephospho-CoA kinase, long form [Microbacteriaceae bacterium]|nr:dephospho-CoA kinase, long form [Microbacteriaceae bacterium]